MDYSIRLIKHSLYIKGMEYALYNGLRTAAQPKLKGLCEHCGGAVQAKCGSIVLWHWAHLDLGTCDSWHEPETLWHRNWKHVFGERYSEIRVEKEGSWHIADVINKDGIVFEFQNSSISGQEIAAREAFYGEKMIWVMNGEAFKAHFEMDDDAYTQEWELKFVGEFEAAERYAPYAAGLIIEDWRVKNERVKQHLNQLGFVHVKETGIYYLELKGILNKAFPEKEISRDIKALYETHKAPQDLRKGRFVWAHARRSWENAKRPVFIDFGGDELYLVNEGMGTEKGRGMSISKEKFTGKYAG